MRKVWLAAIGLAVVGFGCGPRLAQTPYGEKELKWEGYVKESYPGWTPPKTIPPVETATSVQPSAPEKVVVEQETLNIKTPGEPAMEPVAETTAITVEPPKPVPTPAPAPKPQTYTVKKKDSLWKIALKFYGDGRKFTIIKNANKAVLNNGDKIKPGMVLQIPPK